MPRLFAAVSFGDQPKAKPYKADEKGGMESVAD